MLLQDLSSLELGSCKRLESFREVPQESLTQEQPCEHENLRWKCCLEHSHLRILERRLCKDPLPSLL